MDEEKKVPWVTIAIVLLLVGLAFVAAKMVLQPMCSGCRPMELNYVLIYCFGSAGSTPTPRCLAAKTAQAATATAEALPWWQKIGH
jgi:hypothetical protein